MVLDASWGTMFVPTEEKGMIWLALWLYGWGVVLNCAYLDGETDRLDQVATSVLWPVTLPVGVIWSFFCD